MKQLSIFAEVFHTDWSFLDIPPAGTCLYGITIPPIGGNTLFADQVRAYESLPSSLRDKVDSLMQFIQLNLDMPQLEHMVMKIKKMADQ